MFLPVVGQFGLGRSCLPARFWHYGSMVEKGKRPRDTNQLAKWITDIATGQVEPPDKLAGKNPAAVARGKAGGLKGGKARADKLSAKRRRAIAKKGAIACWQKSH